jgi:exopolyphosphatase/guanosine-5'-triphosphate,3'-diphosphate pyrophosphatase
MIKAIIDLGSNTFHLLLAKIENQHITTIIKKRIFVGLGDGGIDVIKQESIIKGLDALHEFKTVLNEYHYDALFVTGTAALRTASNANDFITPAEQLLQTNISIIDGQKEAELIYKGASILSDTSIGYHIIMDIGGGSTEFIIVKESKAVWSYSYKLGVGVLYGGYQHSEPITSEEQYVLREHIQNELSNLKSFAVGISFESLIGASGSFEVLETMSGFPISTNQNRFIPLSTVWEISSRIIKADHNERIKMEGLPENRVKLIVVAMILLEEVLKIINPKTLQITPYALKEGILMEEGQT